MPLTGAGWCCAPNIGQRLDVPWDVSIWTIYSCVSTSLVLFVVILFPEYSIGLVQPNSTSAIAH